MSNAQTKTKTYAIVAAIGIGILAVALVGGLYANVPAANGKSETGIVTSNDCMPGSVVHCIESPNTGKIAGTSTGVASVSVDKENNGLFELFASGSAFKKINPDKVSITLGVEVQEKTAKDAAARNAELMNAIISSLKELVSEKEISTSYYNIYPVYEYPPVVMPEEKYMPPVPQREVLVGYRASNTITITTSASANVGAIIDAAVEAGANQVQGVSFFVSEEVQKQINRELIAQAVLDAKAKAESALSPLGMQIVGVKNVNLNDVYFPVYQKAVFAEGAASAPTPIFPSEQQVSASVSVTFIIGSK